MKNRLILLATLLASVFSFAQEGEILYTDYGSGITKTFWTSNSTPLYLDLDNDGRNEWVYEPYQIWGHNFGLQLIQNFEEFPYQFEPPQYWPFQTIYVNSNDLSSFPHYGDTIPNLRWQQGEHFPQYYYFTHDNPTDFDYGRHFMGVKGRVGEEDDWCYGWIEASVYIHYWIEDQTMFNKIDLVVYRTAYCTIPNYPLCIGQTSLDWGVEDNETTAIVTLHPNPATSQVTIMGIDLKSAEVINTVGQLVATVHGEGDRLTMDISALPAGVYFVSITDSEGRKCVRKVVKE